MQLEHPLIPPTWRALQAGLKIFENLPNGKDGDVAIGRLPQPHLTSRGQEARNNLRALLLR